MIYLDTSALVALYYPEKHSAMVERQVKGKTIPLTPLHEIEFHNAFALKQFRGEATAVQIDRVLKTFEEDTARGVLIRPAVDWSVVWVLAVRFVDQYSARLGNRSLDILHVACACQLKASRFISYDDRQVKLARKNGLAVYPRSPGRYQA